MAETDNPPLHDIAVVFTHPVRNTIVTGTVERIDREGFEFEPFRPELTESLEVGMLIPRCRVKIGTDIAEIACRVLSADNRLHLVFNRLDPDIRGLLLSYLATRPRS
ncbi:MAG: hypothetical protein ACLFM0_01410 [Spirochaetales bacterium]